VNQNQYNNRDLRKLKEAAVSICWFAFSVIVMSKRKQNTIDIILEYRFRI